MNSNDDRPMLDGKPPKSSGEIRSLLKSIHNANNAPPAGPNATGIPKTEMIAARSFPNTVRSSLPKPKHEERDSDFNSRLLLDESAIAGSITGGLLGANLGFAISTMFGASAITSCAIIFGSMMGGPLGIAVARSYVIRRRPDLFGRVMSRSI